MVAPRSPAFAFRLLSAAAVASIATGVDVARAQDPRSRVSVDSNGGEADRDCWPAAVSADGRFVGFLSDASNLVAGDLNGMVDVFVHDRVTGATVRVNVDSGGNEADGPSQAFALSADGRFVAFDSAATNLVAGDTNGALDVFVHDRDPDGNGVFDEGNGVTTRVSVRTSGLEGNGDSTSAAISADGKFVAFTSHASNLVAGDVNGVDDVFVHNRTTGRTMRVSVDSAGVEGNGPSGSPSLSADGRTVAFWSRADNLVANDGNHRDDIFVHDRTTGTTVRASVSSAGAEGNGTCQLPQIAADGSRVVFESLADNLVPNDFNQRADVFLRDLVAGTTDIVSVSTAGVYGNGSSYDAALSADGRLVVFNSEADNLVPGDDDGLGDVFVRDLAAGTTALVSQTCWLKSASGRSVGGAISGDGSSIAFASHSAELVAGDTNGVVDAFVYDRSIPEPVATSTNYGAGFPGAHGIPNLTSNSPPVFGDAVAITVDSSSGIWAPALLALGFERASIPTRAGGTLLVDAPHYYIEAIAPSGLTMPWTVPLDPAFCGLQLDLQVLELDAGAQFGIAFTPGLEWVVGN